MSTHKVNALRAGSANGVEWEAEYVLTFRYSPAGKFKMYQRNGDPADPPDPEEIELIDVNPVRGSRYFNAVPDQESSSLEQWAQEWLVGDGYGAVLETVWSDNEAAIAKAEGRT